MFLVYNGGTKRYKIDRDEPSLFTSRSNRPSEAWIKWLIDTRLSPPGMSRMHPEIFTTAGNVASTALKGMIESLKTECWLEDYPEEGPVLLLPGLPARVSMAWAIKVAVEDRMPPHEVMELAAMLNEQEHRDMVSKKG